MVPVNKVVFGLIRDEGADCAIVSLAMFLGQEYNDVLRKIVEIDKRYKGKVGLSTAQIKKVCKAFGVEVRLKKKVEEDDYGILLMNDHAALVRNGLVINPLWGGIEIWDYDDYVENYTEGVVEGVIIATS